MICRDCHQPIVGRLNAQRQVRFTEADIEDYVERVAKVEVELPAAQAIIAPDIEDDAPIDFGFGPVPRRYS